MSPSARADHGWHLWRRARARARARRQQGRPGAERPACSCSCLISPLSSPPPLVTSYILPMSGQEQRSYRYYDLIMAGFVCVLLCANLIGVSKVTQVTLFGHTFAFGAGNLFFPLSYLFGDTLTEVYGYARSRKVVWAGFGALAFASFMSFVVVHMPPATGWAGQEVIEKAFGSTWRIALASLVGYFV